MKTECSRTRLCGDIEAANGSFKRAVEQHLLLRGSRDFHRLHEYEAFLWHIMDKRNDLRSERLAEELAVMKLLVAKPWPEMRELRPRVSRGGTVRVLNNIYSVPSGLKGKQVRVRVFEWHIEIWYTNQWIENIPRLTGINHHRVHYRHVIDTLLRKPGGFRNYRYPGRPFPANRLPAGLGSAPEALLAPPGGYFLPAHLEAGGARLRGRRRCRARESFGLFCSVG